MPVSASSPDSNGSPASVDQSRTTSHASSASPGQEPGAEQPQANGRRVAEPPDGGERAPTRGRGARAASTAPSSRPAKRRDQVDDDGEETDEDKFPWHFQFHDDEPEELQAKSRLLSRAFRSSVG
jgi:hypothetical protein